MQAEERQDRIEKYLQKVEFASLDDLASQVLASVSTVRRDVAILEGKGAIKRTHGGARLIQPKSDEFSFSSRDAMHLSEKEIIGKVCASLIRPNQSIIMDAGSTVYHVAKYLESKTPQIITNSLPIANHYASNNQAEVVLSGGVIYPRLGVLVGSLAVEAFSQMHADVAIMSSGGITDQGITNSHVLLIEIQKAMIRAVQKVIFCMDGSKFGRKSISHLCGLSEVDLIVTDESAPEEVLDSIRSQGVEVVVAKERMPE